MKTSGRKTMHRRCLNEAFDSDLTGTFDYGCAAAVLTIDEVRSTRFLQEQCLDLLKPYYLDPQVPLQYALEREATHVYFARDREHLGAFFFARLPEKILANRPLIGYMGLTATSASGPMDIHLARGLWKAYLRHAREVNEGDREILAWYRTASPFGLYPCHSLLYDGEPRLNGGFSKEVASLIVELRGHYQLRSNVTEDHPFVVRGYASARYSQPERDRVSTLAKPEAARLLRAFAIDEQNGDRLLMIGRIP